MTVKSSRLADVLRGGAWGSPEDLRFAANRQRHANEVRRQKSGAPHQKKRGWITIPCGAPLPLGPGCYALRADGKILYVGSTNQLYRRIKQHGWLVGDGGVYVKDRGFISGATVSYRKSIRAGDWLMVELRLIRRLQPAFNKAGMDRSRFESYVAAFPLPGGAQ
jgi:hypothetical protein